MALPQLLEPARNEFQRLGYLGDQLVPVFFVFLGSGFEGRQVRGPSGERSTVRVQSVVQSNAPCQKSNLSREPGVMVGVSPTLKLADFLVFFSKYRFAKALSFALYSFSMALRSR